MIDVDVENGAALLRAARAAAGMQQAEVCAAAGIAENTLLDAEKGRRLSPRTFGILAGVYRARGVEIALGPGIACLVMRAGWA